jgi:hypothetical protein
MSMTGDCSSSESESCKIIDVDGFQYFVVDRDGSKGDRRCDGKFMYDFFKVVEKPGVAVSNVRQSHRVVKKRDLEHKLCLESVEDPEICNVDFELVRTVPSFIDPPTSTLHMGLISRRVCLSGCSPRP